MMMSSKNKIAMSLVATALAGAMTVLGSPSAFAAAPMKQFDPAKVTSTDGALTSQELKQVENDLKVLFTVYIVQGKDGTWSANASRAAGSGIAISELEAIAANLNQLARASSGRLSVSESPMTASVSPQYAFMSDGYKRCVIDYSGFGALAGLFSGGAGGFWAFISAKRWADAALVFIRIVGVRAVAGGVAGLAVSLSAAAAWCATPWAR